VDSKVGDFSIGSQVWPGVSKLIEEMGEVGQVLGKLIGTGGRTDHWDGTNLRDRLHEELSDLLAAVRFFITVNGFNASVIENRAREKEAQFWKWQRRE